MNPVTYTVTGTASGRAVNMDYRQNPFCVSVGAVVNGVATYSVQHTFDDIYAGAPTTWMQNSNLNGTTVTGATNYAFPVTAIRGNVTAATGTANVVFTIIQASNAP